MASSSSTSTLMGSQTKLKESKIAGYEDKRWDKAAHPKTRPISLSSSSAPATPGGGGGSVRVQESSIIPPLEGSLSVRAAKKH